MTILQINEVEQERQLRIEELLEEYGSDWSEHYAAGTFGCHELLDRTSLVVNTLEEFILDHPACIQNEEWYALASQAATALHELYQQIGAVHLDVVQSQNGNKD